MVVLADVPEIRVEDVEDALSQLPERGLVICPSHDKGTGLLAMRPAGLVPFRFGALSFSLHKREAAAQKLPIEVVRAESLARDIDSPDDLRALLSRPGETATHRLAWHRWTDELQLAFSRRFGPPEVTKVGSQGTGSHFVILTTIGPDGKVVPPDHRLSLRNKANQLWHTDSSFKRVPALTSILSARIIPARGGETEYVSTRLAFERLDAALRNKLRKFLCLARLRAFAQPDRARPRHPEERAALPPQCWRMVWKNPCKRPRRDLSRLARLCGRRHGSGGGEKADRRTDGSRDRGRHQLPAPMARRATS